MSKHNVTLNNHFMGAAGMFNSLSGLSVGRGEPNLFYIPILV